MLPLILVVSSATDYKQSYVISQLHTIGIQHQLNSQPNCTLSIQNYSQGIDTQPVYYIPLMKTRLYHYKKMICPVQ